jgi:hypothetical protein
MATTTKVVTAIAETYRVTISFEEKVNLFLDGLLAAQNYYAKFIGEWKNVNELVDQYITECHSKDELTILLLAIDGLVNTADSLIIKLKGSPFEKILPSTVKDIEENLDHIKEIQSDIRIIISDLPELLSVESKLAGLGF